MFNACFWGNIFESDYKNQYDILIDTLRSKLLPAFNSIDVEAEKIVEDEYLRVNSTCCDPNVDSSEVAEWAQNAGINYYCNMINMEQSLLNMFAMTVYHTFEQQMIEFHRREVMGSREQYDNSNFKQHLFIKTLKVHGIDIKNFYSWDKIDELRLLANTIKHGEGLSSEKLYEKNRSLFEQDIIVGAPWKGSSSSRVFKPLYGEDIYVNFSDIENYCDALKNFWSELTVALIALENL